jgi:hypothetical protein
VKQKQKRSKEAKAAHIRRSIRKFGDSDGSRKSVLEKLGLADGRDK